MSFVTNIQKDYELAYARFHKACENQDFSLAGKYNIVISGRYLTNKLLETYKNSSDTSMLTSFLEISSIIAPCYPNYKSVDDLSDLELTLISDKCKYFIQLIFVQFQLNKVDIAEIELLAYKAHLEKYRNLNEGFSKIYENIKELLHSFKIVSINKENSVKVNVCNRMGLQKYEEVNICLSKGLKLHRAIIIGSCSTQASLKSRTIDMFRMSQAIEFKIGMTQRKNVRKWMFYNSIFWDVEIGIAEALNRISKNGIMLLYISGDSYEMTKKASKTQNSLYHFGIKMKQNRDEKVEHSKIECIYPGDLESSIYVPTVLIIDSECSRSFQELSMHIDVPFLCLLSPKKYPEYIVERNVGKLFTLFLTSPHTAFCLICHRPKLYDQIWQEFLHAFNDFMFSLAKIVDKWIRKSTTNKIHNFMNDVFCRAFLLRYLFCLLSLKLGSEFTDDDYHPRSNIGSLEREVIGSSCLQNGIYKMAAIIRGSDYFDTSYDLSTSNESIDVEA